MEGEQDPRKRLKYFKGQQTYKKGAITTRMKKLDELVANSGSRRLIKTMSDCLLIVFQELKQVCDEISYISEEFDDLNSVEEIRVRVEMCVSIANESLEVRAYDPPSTETSSWVQKHAEVVHEEGVLDLERDVQVMVMLPPPPFMIIILSFQLQMAWGRRMVCMVHQIGTI